MNSFERVAFRLLGKIAGKKRDKYADSGTCSLTPG